MFSYTSASVESTGVSRQLYRTRRKRWLVDSKELSRRLWAGKEAISRRLIMSKSESATLPSAPGEAYRTEADDMDPLVTKHIIPER